MKSRIKKNSWLQDITPSEYTVGIIKCTVRFLLILYLFYESILPAILLFPLWFLYMKEWMEDQSPSASLFPVCVTYLLDYWHVLLTLNHCDHSTLLKRSYLLSLLLLLLLQQFDPSTFITFHFYNLQNLSCLRRDYWM
jgi:hypothetical protein